MRILVISDIHANLAALEAVLADAAGEWEQMWCLGDVIGYGPDPNECVALVRSYNPVCLSGNHDWAILGKLPVEEFNPEAQTAILWTRRQLTEESRAYLDNLPPLLVHPPFTLAHASPRQPIWEYVTDGETAAANFAHFETPYCLVGHSHVPIIFQQVNPTRLAVYRPVYQQPVFLGDLRLIINPGSVGQPRDSDPRAAYALLDTDELTWEYRRVEYPVATTQAKMRQAGLPYRLIARLEVGW